MPRPVPPHVPKHRLPMAPVGREIAALTRKAFSRFGFADDHVLTRWAEIAGPELARVSAPERLSRPTSSARAGGTGATLTVRVAGAAAIELQHMAPEIIARINGFYGRPVVGRLKLVQGPLPTPSRAPAPADSPGRRRAPARQAPDAAPDDPLAAALDRLEHALRHDP